MLETSDNYDNCYISYLALAVFLIIVISLFIYRINSCKDNKEDENEDEQENYKDLDKESKNFLNLNLYQNVPVDNYNYLTNYPNGPFSWGEWSWGNNQQSKGDCKYSILNPIYDKNIRTINNL